jgi:predicted peptidase
VRSTSLFLLTLLVILFAPRRASAQQTENVQTANAVKPLKYLLYVPDTAEADRPLPLVLFLHGGGEGGDDLQKVKKHGLPKLIAGGKQFPFIVVSPQNPSETQFWDDQQLMRLLEEVQAAQPVDRSLVYLTGLSRGGYAAWRLAIQNPDRFAALVPISGGGAVPYAKKIKHLPTWVFHGAKDPVIPLNESQRMVDALKAVDGNVRFTIYPEAKHDAWTKTYDDPKLYKWLLQQQRPEQTEE